jgi:hypothetical protein
VEGRPLDALPAPVRVSSLIRPGGTQGRGFVRRVLAAIDRVHFVSNLPALRIDVAPLKPGRPHAQFDGERILVNRTSDTRELALVHEIGHALDYFAIDAARRTYASDAGAPILNDWRRAVEESSSVYQLRQARATLPALGSRTAAYVEYLLKPSELFARSYAQWLAATSGEATLARQVALLIGDASAIPGPVQWMPDEFTAIGETIDRLMERLGWIR